MDVSVISLSLLPLRPSGHPMVHHSGDALLGKRLSWLFAVAQERDEQVADLDDLAVPRHVGTSKAHCDEAMLLLLCEGSKQRFLPRCDLRSIGSSCLPQVVAPRGVAILHAA